MVLLSSPMAGTQSRPCCRWKKSLEVQLLRSTRACSWHFTGPSSLRNRALNTSSPGRACPEFRSALTLTRFLK